MTGTTPEALTAVVALIVSPIVTELAKRCSWAEGLAAPINAAASVLVFLAGWLLEGGDVGPWILWGLAASSVAVSGHTAIRRMRGEP